MMILEDLDLFVFLVQLLAVPHQFFDKLINLSQGGIVYGSQLIGGGLERRQHRLETAGRSVRAQLLADLQVHLRVQFDCVC